MVCAASTLVILATSLLPAVTVQAEDIGVCTDASCASDCPLNVMANHEPECWTYNVDELDNKGFELNPSGGYVIYLDIPQPGDNCQHIIGSGAGCGAVVGRYYNAICTRQTWTTTMSFGYCCGDNCGGNSQLQKRDCTGFNAEDQFDIIGDSESVSNRVIGPAQVNIEKSVSTSRTTTFSSSAGDPYGVISVEVGFEFEESVETSLTYVFEVLEGQVGYIGWSPTMSCVRGTLTGCGDAGDQTGQACTPKKDSSGEVIGQYDFVTTSRVVKEGKRPVEFTS
ncbi:hypothetical protein BJX70DRAFT_396954 [Aspergillus crustosus]